jgi:peptidoglycan/LPS O-acetylase OafA/YrhL
MRNRPWLTFAVLFGGGMAFRTLAAYHGTGMVSYYFGSGTQDLGTKYLYVVRQFIGVLPLFAVGMLARRLQIRYESRQHRDRSTSFTILLLLLIPSVVALQWVETGLDYQHRVLFVIYEPLLVLLMVPAVVYAGRAALSRPTLLTKASLWVGERSYSLYLWHFPIILAVFGRGPEVSPAHMTHAWLRVALVAVLSLVVAAVSYNGIEKPARIYGRRLASKLH